MGSCSVVEEGDENRVAARLVNLFVTTDSSSVSMLGCSHSKESFPFSPQHVSFFFHYILSFFLTSLSFIFCHVSFIVCPCVTYLCCYQFPDGRTWVVSPLRQRRKCQTSWRVSEKSDGRRSLRYAASRLD